MTDDVDKINVSDRLVLQPGVEPIPVVWRQVGTFQQMYYWQSYRALGPYLIC